MTVPEFPVRGDQPYGDKLKAYIDAAITGPEGPDGPPGPPNTLAIGTVVEGPADASITGVAPNQVLNLTIPRGADGADGIDGVNGTNGTNGVDGADGADGAPGPPNTLTIGAVTSPPVDPTASITGASPNQTLNLGLPRGAAGEPGPVGPVGLSIVGTLDGGVYTVNPAYGTEYALTITANTTLSATGLTNGASVTVTVLQDSAGAHTLTLNSAWIGAADITPNTTAGYYDVYVIWESPFGTFIKRVHTGEMPSSAWTPHQLTGQAFWWNADSIPLADGDTFVNWESLWAGDETLVPDTVAPSIEISHGIKAVKFEAANSEAVSYNTPTLNQPFTVALLAKMSDLASSNDLPVFGGQGALDFVIDVKQSGGGPKWCGHQQPGGAVTGNWQVVVVQVDGASSSVRVDGSSTTVNINGTISSTSVALADTAANNFFSNVRIAEVICVSNLPSAPNLASLETYLGGKRDTLNGA